MRSTRLIPMGLLALSLALAMPAAASAQDAERETLDFAFATGEMVGPPAKFVPPQEERAPDGSVQTRGGEILGIPLEFSDERLSGRLQFLANGSAQEAEDGYAVVERRSYRLENDGGTWAGTGEAVFAEGPEGVLIDRELLTLVGEGGYDGLMAFVYAETVDDEIVLEAVVLENELAPRPGPISTDGDGLLTFADAPSIDEYLGSIVEDSGGGMVAYLVRDGQTRSGATGIADAAGDPLRADAAFRVGSVSKPFVAVMVLQLAEEGLIDLDAPLSAYLPDTPVGGDVTIRQLLSHQSGIPNVTDVPNIFADLFADPERSWTVDEVIDTIVDVPGTEPGTEFAYSNTNYVLLGQLVESVGGDELDDALQSRIVQPLGLESTAFDIDDSQVPDNLALGWVDGVFEGAEGEPYESISSHAWAAGALISTPGDLATFITGLFDGRLISQEMLAEMLTTGEGGYGLGLHLVPPDATASEFYGHGGGIPGYGTFLAADPETGDAVVVISTAEGANPFSVGDEILRTWEEAPA